MRPVLEHPEIESLRLDQDLQSARRDLIEASWLSCRNEEYGYESQVRENLTRLLLLIGDGRPQMLMENAEKYRRYNERTKQMLTFIKRHFGEELSVRAIADSASISESECLRCFRKILDTSPIAYLKTYRLQRAARASGDYLKKGFGYRRSVRIWGDELLCKILSGDLPVHAVSVQEPHIKSPSRLLVCKMFRRKQQSDRGPLPQRQHKCH